MQVEIWSDVVCPWCYIGKRRLDVALDQLPDRDQVDVVYRSFQLDPHAPRGQTRPTPEALAEKYGQSAAGVRAMIARTEQAARAEGLAYKLAGTLKGNTMDAHRLLHLAADRGLAEAAFETFCYAYFVDNRSLFDHHSLAELAADAGLDASEAADVLASDRYADAVIRDQLDAQALGATGVPLFVAGRTHGVVGAQPPDVLLDMLERAREALTADASPARRK